MEKIRSFLGIKLHDFPDIRNKIIDLRNKYNARMSIVKPELYHITLHFFGDLSLTQIENITDILSAISFDPFELSLQTFGSFPNNPKRTRVLFVDINSGLSEIKNLHNNIMPLLSKNGFNPENREYSPHLTVARIKYGKKLENLTKSWHEMQLEEKYIIKVSEFQLFSSTFTPDGVKYNIQHRFKFST